MHFHDQRMRRLIASGLLPERAGHPVKVWAHVTLAELCTLDDGSLLQDVWIAEMAVRWAAYRAADSDGTGGDGGAWLNGAAAKAMACDAVITPVVTGDVDPGVLDDLVRLCVELDRIEHGTAQVADSQAGPSRQALRKTIIGKAVDLLSGPGGLASFLRTQQLGARLAGPSLPLDIGFSKTIPPGTVTPSSCVTGAAGGPAAATSPRRPAKCTTSST